MSKKRECINTYRKITIDLKIRQDLHRFRAERALGKPLPRKAIVHHADGSKGDDSQLVICQDQSYHRLLHKRMRIQAAGGNPNTDKVCAICQLAKPLEAFSRNRVTLTDHPRPHQDGRAAYCRECLRAQRLTHGATITRAFHDCDV